MGSYKTGVRSGESIMVPEFQIEMKPFFESMYSSFKEECIHVQETLEYSGVKVIPVEASLGIQTAQSVIQTAVNPFFPRAGIITILFNVSRTLSCCDLTTWS
jgi:hypothetical protein